MAAYDKGNGLNLMALSALVVQPAGEAPETPGQSGSSGEPVPRVLSEGDVSAETWAMVRDSMNLVPDRTGDLATMHRVWPIGRACWF